MRGRREPTTAGTIGRATRGGRPAAGEPGAAADPAEDFPVERLRIEDLMQLATAGDAAASQVGALLTFQPGVAVSLDRAREILAERVVAVRRLRQRLYRVPVGHGRPVWVDDPGFDIRWHVTAVPCPPPGDERALLNVAARIVTAALPSNRPLWSATLVTGLADGGTAMVLVFHHVLADGIGGLAALARLVDGAPVPDDAHFPRPAPTRRALRADARSSRRRALADARSWLSQVRGALAELSPGGPRRAQRCSLNRPTGAHRRLATAQVDLEAIRRGAHAHDGTVNDAVLAAVAGALGTVLLTRGETVDTVTVSVPVSARREATAERLGNRLGVQALPLPAAGARTERLARIAGITRTRKAAARGESALLLGPLFRLLAAVGLIRWFANHQRLVHSFVTNLRGPVRPLPLLGVPVTGIVPISAISGNVTVAFATLSYAGTLTVTIVVDPDAWPDLGYLAERLQHELDAVAAAGSPRARDTTRQ